MARVRKVSSSRALSLRRVQSGGGPSGSDLITGFNYGTIAVGPERSESGAASEPSATGPLCGKGWRDWAGRARVRQTHPGRTSVVDLRPPIYAFKRRGSRWSTRGGPFNRRPTTTGPVRRVANDFSVLRQFNRLDNVVAAGERALVPNRRRRAHDGSPVARPYCCLFEVGASRGR